MVRICLYLFACLFFASCANKTLIRDSEYQPVYHALKNKEPKQALLHFPNKEINGFITTFEKAWIKFWTSSEQLLDDEIKSVQNLSDQIEKRKFVSISYEASVFLVGESEDGYIPSEHEIISLHLFLAMLYLDNKNFSSARVELRRAVEYLANNPEGKETTFDDPAIRLWLSALWEALGAHDDANVDLRKALELSGNKSLQQIIDNSKRKVHLLLNDLGPKINWSESGSTVSFDYRVPTQQIKTYHVFTTRTWYDWHQSRNTKIRESLLKSRYMTMALEHQTSRISKQTVGLAGTAAYYVGAVAAVAVGGYLGLQLAQSGVLDPDAYVGVLGFTAIGAVWFIEKGHSFYDSVGQKIKESDRKKIDLRKTYRMIRFLPSSIEYIDENLATSKTRYYSGYRKTLGTGHNQVEFIWNPE